MGAAPQTSRGALCMLCMLGLMPLLRLLGLHC